MVTQLNVFNKYDEAHYELYRVLHKSTMQTVLAFHLNHQFCEQAPDKVLGDKHAVKVCLSCV